MSSIYTTTTTTTTTTTSAYTESYAHYISCILILDISACERNCGCPPNCHQTREDARYGPPAHKVVKLLKLVYSTSPRPCIRLSDECCSFGPSPKYLTNSRRND